MLLKYLKSFSDKLIHILMESLMGREKITEEESLLTCTSWGENPTQVRIKSITSSTVVMWKSVQVSHGLYVDGV
jgi:hypothetical protein